LELASGSFQPGTVCVAALFAAGTQSNELLHFEVPLGEQGLQGVTSQTISQGAIFALSPQIVQYQGRMYLSFVEDLQLKIARRAAMGSGPWQVITASGNPVFYSSDLTVSENGLILAGFDATDNDIKLFASSDGVNFDFSRSVTAPEGVIFGAIRGSKRFSLAADPEASTNCVLYEEVFSTRTRVRVNCEDVNAQASSLFPAQAQTVFDVALSDDHALVSQGPESDNHMRLAVQEGDFLASFSDREDNKFQLFTFSVSEQGLALHTDSPLTKGTSAQVSPESQPLLVGTQTLAPSSGVFYSQDFRFLEGEELPDAVGIFPRDEGGHLVFLDTGAVVDAEIHNIPPPFSMVGGVTALTQVMPVPGVSGGPQVAVAYRGGSLNLAVITFLFDLFFPQIADGGGLFSQIILYALDRSADTHASLILKDDDGQPLTVDLNEESVQGELAAVVPAGGLRRFKTDGQGELTVGSVTVSSDRPLAGVILFGGAFGVAGVGASTGFQPGFVAPMETNVAEGTNTGIAVMNLENQEFNLDLKLCDADDNPVAEAQIKLPGSGHFAKFVNEFEWDKVIDFSSFQGTLKVLAPGRITATVLQTRKNFTQLATMPVTGL
jgi:hypothetical protein